MSLVDTIISYDLSDVRHLSHHDQYRPSVHHHKWRHLFEVEELLSHSHQRRDVSLLTCSMSIPFDRHARSDLFDYLSRRIDPDLLDHLCRDMYYRDLNCWDRVVALPSPVDMSYATPSGHTSMTVRGIAWSDNMRMMYVICDRNAFGSDEDGPMYCRVRDWRHLPGDDPIETLGIDGDNDRVLLKECL